MLENFRSLTFIAKNLEKYGYSKLSHQARKKLLSVDIHEELLTELEEVYYGMNNKTIDDLATEGNFRQSLKME